MSKPIAIDCPRCLGEDFPHHATHCPLRGDLEGDVTKLPIKTVESSGKSHCAYCGLKVTRATFMEDHTGGKCNESA